MSDELDPIDGPAEEKAELEPLPAAHSGRRLRSRRFLALTWLALAATMICCGFVFWQRARDRADEVANVQIKPTPKQEQKLNAADEFEATLEKSKPVFWTISRACPACGAEFNQPAGDAHKDNAYGGVATDLMRIALSPPEGGHGPPGLDVQAFDQLVGTCPKCCASFQDIDFINLNSGLLAQGSDKLNTNWDIKKLAPPLAARPQESWTYDERNLVRYLTQQVEGYPEHELGYGALAGAYSSNLSTYLGRDYHIPAAAFYALAAAHFKRYIDGGSYENEQAATYVAMTLGEMYRLLGRQIDAGHAFDKARSITAAAAKAGGKTVDNRTLKMLDYLADLNTKGDFGLHRSPLEDQNGKPYPVPPVGWYLDTMLPAINAELDVQRGHWSNLDDPAVIFQRMLAEPAVSKP